MKKAALGSIALKLYIAHFFLYFLRLILKFLKKISRVLLRSRNKKMKKKSFHLLEKIRVGKDYQVVVPEMNPKTENYPDKALLVWSPAKEIPEMKLDEYIDLAKDTYGYNAEQALGMLFWHKHDLQKAVVDLQNFTPFPDEWTSEDKVMFEQAYQFHGKCFHRIRQMVK